MHTCLSQNQNSYIILPWLVWLSGLNACLQTKGSPVLFPVRAHAWVVDQVPTRGHTRSNHTLLFLSLSFSLPFFKNKFKKSLKKFIYNFSTPIMKVSFLYLLVLAWAPCHKVNAISSNRNWERSLQYHSY